MARPRRLPLSAALAAALAAAVSGCGLGAGEEASSTRLLVTDDFGTTVITRADAPQTGGSDTVMRLLQRNTAKVVTRYGGGFVQSIDGRAGGTPDGRPVDWFFYVGGVLSPTGGAARRVRDGDTIWWDRHDWGAGETRAVVGSFPEPFRHGLDGRARPVRVECAAAATAACATVAAALADAGVTAARTPLRGGAGRDGALRILVGTFAALRRDPAARTLERGPRVSGVYARPARDGAALAVLDPRGRPARTLTAGAGLVAATVLREDPPVWLVTGTDAPGLMRAAATLTPDRLTGRFAVAARPDGAALPVPLP